MLSLGNIRKSFGTFEALKGVDLDIAEGEFICLLGGSGCGKTTLLRIIAGLEQHTSGTLQLGDTNLSEVPCHKRNVGMVFQTLALFPHLSVGENIAYGLDIRGVAKAERQARADDLLNTVGLSGLGDRAVSALSGGQRQRVAIARALAIKPALFLMDEPFSALDAGLREHLQIEVKKLQRKLGVTTIFVTHDQNEAMSIADRIVILNGGQVEQSGTPMEVYSKPATRFVAEFMGTNNVFEATFTPGGDVTVGAVALGAPPAEHAGLSGPQTIAVRPEYLTLGAPDAGGLTGTVEFVRLLGNAIETEVNVGGQTFIHTMTSDRPQMFKVGDAAGVSFDMGRAVVLPA